MLLRIVSDLHLDINSGYGIKIPRVKNESSIFTLIAGDLGGDYEYNASWLLKNVSRGAFISGNHDAYVPYWEVGKKKVPVEFVKEFYHEKFPLEGNITYMDDYVGVISKDLGENVLLVADVMYTDYKFKATEEMKGMKVEERVKKNVYYAEPKAGGGYMNDFRFFTRRGKYVPSVWEMTSGSCPEGCSYIRAKNYMEHFSRAFKNITKVIESNPDKDIVLMTHHCLSGKCASFRFQSDCLNASYMSDKESWIKKHPNIKLIVSGHVHHKDVFRIGKALYVLNPLGYVKYGENMSCNSYGEVREWSPNFFVDTKTWEVVSFSSSSSFSTDL